MKSCFWNHSWDKWEQLEPKKMYAIDLRATNPEPYLDYTIYTQKRYCKICNKMEIESKRINNY